MNAKSTKSTGTKTSTPKTALQKTQARAANRQAKLVAKHEAIRKSVAKREPNAAGVSIEQKVATAAGEALAQPPAKDNAMFKAAGMGQFADALNKATVAQLEDALKLDCWTAKQRGRIEAALKTRVTPAPADETAKTVAAVEKGDLTKGVTIPAGGKKKATTKAANPDRKMSGLDAAAKVLAESPEPMNAKAIVEAMKTKGYWSSTAATPHATIYAAMIVEIAKKGDLARFRKADRGLFTVTAAGKEAK